MIFNFLFGKEKSSEMFFHIFNEIINNNHQIVITSDKMPDELQGIEERLISRFKIRSIFWNRST